MFGAHGGADGRSRTHRGAARARDQRALLGARGASAAPPRLPLLPARDRGGGANPSRRQTHLHCISTGIHDFPFIFIPTITNENVFFQTWTEFFKAFLIYTTFLGEAKLPIKFKS